MILTITPAPSIDWTVTVDAFELGGVNRITSSYQEASGKGVNVSWALHHAGIATEAIFPCGGRSGSLMTEQLSDGGLDYVIVPTKSDVRTNITLVTPDSSGTKVNMPGSPLTQEETDKLLRIAASEAVGAATIITCGSLPANAPESLHRDIVRSVRAAEPGARIVVDTSGEPMNLALEASPDLIKPNVHELSALTNRDIATIGDVVEAAKVARGMGAGAVLASLGADGLVYLDAEGAIYGKARDIPVVNAIGAGDALLAGFVGGGRDRLACVRNALLWASSAVACTSTVFPVRSEFSSQMDVDESFDSATLLSEPSIGKVRI